MKILIFNWRDVKHSWAGGGEMYIFELATRWVKMGHSITIFCGQDYKNTLPSFEIINGIHIYRKGGMFSVYLWAIYYYFIYLKKTKPDVVIDVANGIPFFTPLFCRLPKVSFVYHIHGDQFFYELPFPLSHIGYAVERFIFPLLYKRLFIVAISETTKQQLIKIGFNKDRISLVYCGINKSKSQLKIDKEIKKFSTPTILYLGRVKKYKRVGLLINIFPRIIEKVPRAHLIIAGWGTEASNVADLAMRSPLRKKITLVGPVSNTEKEKLLSKSWIFVNPSIGEGWSIAVIEANAYGTPAVALNVSGLAESIQDGKTGLLAKDEKDLVNKICEILKDTNLRERLSKNAIEWANSFSWDNSAQESLHILEKIRNN